MRLSKGHSATKYKSAPRMQRVILAGRVRPRLAHEGRRMGWEPPLPDPLLHKCVEEREKTRGFALHEPAVGSVIVIVLTGLPDAGFNFRRCLPGLNEPCSNSLEFQGIKI
jgi:hypothetical protein